MKLNKIINKLLNQISMNFGFIRSFNKAKYFLKLKMGSSGST